MWVGVDCVTKFEISRPLFSWRNSRLNKVWAQSFPLLTIRVNQNLLKSSTLKYVMERVSGTPCVSMEDIMYTFLSIVNLTEMSYIVTIGLVIVGNVD